MTLSSIWFASGDCEVARPVWPSPVAQLEELEPQGAAKQGLLASVTCSAHHGRWVGQLLVGAIFIFFVTCLISDFRCNAATAKEVQQLAQAADRYRQEDIVECPQLQLQSANSSCAAKATHSIFFDTVDAQVEKNERPLRMGCLDRGCRWRWSPEVIESNSCAELARIASPC